MLKTNLLETKTVSTTLSTVNNLRARSAKSPVSGHWAGVLKHMAGLFQKEVFNTWFAPIRCIEESENGVVLAVVNDFAAIWVEDNYLDLIRKQFSLLYGHAISVTLKVEGEAPAATERMAAAQATLLPVERTVSPQERAVRVATNPHRTSRNKLTLNPRYTFENFIVGSSNQLAHAASVAVAQNLGRAYNPLFIYGETGLGKTHLMHAIAHACLEQNPQANIAYVSCEKFTNEFIRAIQEHTLTTFRKQYRSVDVLLVDDIQFLEGKERIQEEFFHTFNELFESQRQIVLTSDRPAGEIAKLEARLISRFQWGMVTDIQAPDLETRVAILRRKAGLLNARIPDDILAFLAKSITRNVRRMEGALTRVASFSTLVNGTVELSKVEQLLQDILQEEAQNLLTIEKIQKRVVEYYQLRPGDMQSKRRPSNIAFPRQVAMYLCRLLTTHSLQEIGETFGGRDHGTVIHACKTVENFMEQDEAVKRAVEFLTSQLSRRS